MLDDVDVFCGHKLQGKLHVLDQFDLQRLRQYLHLEVRMIRVLFGQSADVLIQSLPPAALGSPLPLVEAIDCDEHRDSCPVCGR